MSDLEDVTRLPDDFDGRVRLFPLPELVLFPHAMQPLHIFEPRYCEMLADSLADDHLIAMTTLTGGPSIIENQPPIATTVCLGKIISHVETDNQRHNILLVGTRRARVVRELDTGRPFRMAEVDVHSDVYPPSGAEFRVALKQHLLQTFGSIIPQSSHVQHNLCELMAGQMGLGPITDIISYTLPFEIEQKLQLLSEPDVDQRAKLLIKLLESGTINLHSVTAEEQSLDNVSQPDDRFPPPFSLN